MSAHHITYTVTGSGRNPDCPDPEEIHLTFVFHDHEMAVAAQEYGRKTCPEWRWVIYHNRADSMPDFVAEVDSLRVDFDKESK